MYKNYIFDLYGTLIDLYTDEEKMELWKNLALFYSYNGTKYSPHILQIAYQEEVKKEIEKNDKTDFPDIKVKKVLKKLYKGNKVSNSVIDSTVKMFRLLSTDSIRLYDGVIETLETLKERGAKIFLLSNGQREFSLPELKYLEIEKFFDGLYFSADKGICKPDQKFIKKLIRKEKLNIEECVMIGNDYTTDIETANRVGMDSVYFDSNHSKTLNDSILNATYKIFDGNFKYILEI